MVALLIFVLHAIWNFICSTASIGVIVGGIATAVAVLLPKQLDFITDLRKWAIVVAVLAFSFTTIAGKFYNDGIAFTKGQWDTALAREAEQGEAARSDAVGTLGPVSSDRSVFSDDRHNRDRGKHPAEHKGPVRWLEEYRLLRR